MNDIKKTNSKKLWLTVSGVMVTVYAVSLFLPYISNVTTYPYHFLRCGGIPIAATKFAAAYTYTVPGGEIYYQFGDTYFCSEQEAKDAGFRRYP